VKRAAWQRDQGKFVECGSTNNLHFDHIIPYSRGGSSLVAENIQLMCARRKGVRRVARRRVVVAIWRLCGRWRVQTWAPDACLCGPVAPFAICRGRRPGLVPDRIREVDGWMDRGVGPVDDVLQCRMGKPGCLF
jgi:hypothetical protein